MQLQLPHSVEYTNRGKISVRDIAHSLMSNEILLIHTAKLLEEIDPGLKIDRIEISFKEATHDSPLKQLLVLQLFVNYQKDLEKEIPKFVDNILGTHIAGQYDAIVSTLFLLLVIYVGEYIYNKLHNNNRSSKYLSSEYDRLLKLASKQYGVTIETLNITIQNSFNKLTEKRTIVKTVLDFFRPAKRERGATITTGKDYTLSPKAIEEIPSDAELNDEDIVQTAYQNVEIALRATDVDRNKSGWAGKPLLVYDGRLKMQVYPSIDLKKLHGKTSVTGDIILVSKKDEDGNFKPYMFHLVRILEDAPKRRASKKIVKSKDKN